MPPRLTASESAFSEGPQVIYTHSKIWESQARSQDNNSDGNRWGLYIGVQFYMLSSQLSLLSTQKEVFFIIAHFWNEKLKLRRVW